MSEKNVETVRRVYEGVNARLEVPRELFDPAYGGLWTRSAMAGG